MSINSICTHIIIFTTSSISHKTVLTAIIGDQLSVTYLSNLVHLIIRKCFIFISELLGSRSQLISIVKVYYSLDLNAIYINTLSFSTVNSIVDSSLFSQQDAIYIYVPYTPFPRVLIEDPFKSNWCLRG